MALATNYDKLENVWIEQRFNVPTSTTDAEGVTTNGFYPLVLTARGQAITTDGGRKDVVKTATVGNVVTTPLTNKQIYDQITLVTNLHTRTRTLLKDLYTEAISVDISA